MGADRALTICRERTKLHEEVRGTTGEQANAYERENPPRGEFVLVMAGAAPKVPEEMTLEDAVDLALQKMEEGMSATAAAKAAAAASPFSKSEIYKACIEKGDERE